MKKTKVCSIIAAGGSGTRMGVKGGKQFLMLAGFPMVIRTIQKFDAADSIDDIVVVVASDKIAELKRWLKKTKIKKVRQVAVGGKRRQDSVANAIAAINFPCDIVLVHDGARPFVSEKEIKDVIRGAQKYGACLVATPVKDTLKIVQGGKVVSSPDRRHFWAAQTPQGFKFKLLKAAYARAASRIIDVTDDA
ncbi:MAG: 2-C-methyl-D-erythritol 4-phosphate cytidylyltransferase, partial [Candidatus Margulisiibacteriota bacterium]